LEIVQEIIYEIVELINVAVSDCHGLSVGTGNLIVLFSAILNVRARYIIINTRPLTVAYF
jgi:hypothetical protein